MANYTWGQGAGGPVSQAKPLNVVNMGTGDSLSNQGFGEAAQNARAQGYGGPFYRPQDYADAYGQNMGKAMNVLQGGFSGQSQGSADYQNAIRSAAMSRLGGLQNNMAGRKELMKADMDQGFQNNLDMLRRGAAGTGAAGSMGYGRSVGDLSNKYQQNLGRGLLDVESQGSQELGQLGDIGQQLFGQEMADRLQQYNQAQDLSQLYSQLGQTELGRQQEEAQIQAADTAARKAAQAQIGQLIGYHVSGQSGQDAMKSMGGSGGGMAAMFSDKNLKENVESADTELRDFLDKVKPMKYNYKSEKHGKGKHYSPMAQDLEKHPVGKSMVEDTAEGKRVDYGKGLGVMMALHAHVNKRLSKLEADEVKEKKIESKEHKREAKEHGKKV